MATINCPNCNQSYEVDDNVIGEKIECAYCNTTFLAREIKTAEPIKLQLNPQGQDEGPLPKDSTSAQPSATPPQPRLDKKLIALFSACCAVIVILLIAVIVLLAQRGTGGTIAYSNQPVGPLPTGTPSELLLKYTELGETPYVAEVLKQNPSFEVDRPRADGNKTALYLASEKGYEDIVKLLLKHKADAAICDSETGKKYSPLTIAARKGHLAIVKALLKSGIKIESRDGENRTPLYAAAANNQTEVVEFLCKSKAEINSYGRNGFTPLTAAANTGYAEVVKILLKHGADMEMREKANEGGSTAVYQASIGNHTDIVEILCKSGAKVNVCGINGWTPLTLAADRGYTKVVNALLKYGKKIDLEMPLKGEKGNSTAVFLAAARNHPEAVELLCKAGANVNVYGGELGYIRYDEETPLTYAARMGYTDVLNALVKYGKGIDLEMRQLYSLDPTTPLYHAVAYNQPGSVEILCKAGANLSFHSSLSGETPLTRAVNDGKIDVVKILLKYGADPYQRRSLFDKRNSFEIARLKNRQDIVDLLNNPARLETKESAKSSNTQNLKSAHEYVMKSINDIQRGNYAGGTDMDSLLSG